MKVKLQFSQKKHLRGYNITTLERIKAMEDNGKYIKFAPHNKNMIEHLEKVEIDLPNYVDIDSKF